MLHQALEDTEQEPNCAGSATCSLRERHAPVVNLPSDDKLALAEKEEAGECPAIRLYCTDHGFKRLVKLLRNR